MNARFYWCGQLQPELVVFQFFDHGANRDVFQGVSQVGGPLVLKLLPVELGIGPNSNSREMQLLQEGLHPFCVRVFGLFTKALGPHVYSCLVESMSEKTVSDALLASVGMPCTAASLEVALRTLWSVAYLWEHSIEPDSIVWTPARGIWDWTAAHRSERPFWILDGRLSNKANNHKTNK